MGNDLRTALRNAINEGKVDSAPAAAAPAAPAAPAPAPVSAEAAPAAAPAAPAAPTQPRDDAGKFAPRGEAGSVPAAVPDAASQATPPKHKPPASWSPAVREKFGTLPEDVQEEIARVAKAEADRVRRAAEAEKRWGEWQETIRPYDPILRASGDPRTAVDQALRAVATLRTGTAREKAALLASMVKDYGVGIEDLDSTLAETLGGAPAARAASQLDPEAIIKAAEERVTKRLATAAEQQRRAKFQADIESFKAKAEFFDDLEADMAGLIQSGLAKDLQSAYDKAIMLHPEIAGVIEQRKAAEAARTGNAATERAMAAASSVRASPVSAGAPAPTDLRSMLRANMARER